MSGKSRVHLYALIMTAFLIRAHVVLASPQSFYISAFKDHYGFAFEAGSIARSLYFHHGYASPFTGDTGPTAWLAPVFPLIVLFAYKVYGIFTPAAALFLLFLNCACGAGIAAILSYLGKRLLTPASGICAAWVWALTPFFMHWVTWPWETTLSAFLAMLLLACALDGYELRTHRGWLGYGVLFGISLLTNPALLLVVLPMLVWIAFKLQRVRILFFTAITCIAVITPWLVRDYRIFGRFIFIRDNLPFELTMSNFHLSSGMGWVGRHPSVNPNVFAQYKTLGEAEFLRQRSLMFRQFVEKNPGEFVRLTATRIWAFWEGDAFRYEVAATEWQVLAFGALSFAGLLGMLLAIYQRRTAAAALLLVVLLYPAPYYLTVPSMRFRFVIDPLLLLYSMFLLSHIGANAKRLVRTRSVHERSFSEIEPARV